MSTVEFGQELDLAQEKSRLTDVFTVPNGMTLGRLLAAPWAYHVTSTNPGEDFNWLKVGAVSLSDLEGNVARLENLTGIAGKIFHAIGCRQSEIGRQGDPVADFAYGSAVVAGGLKSGAIPKPIAKVSLYQKTLKAAVTTAATAQGKELEVNVTGKAGELVQVLGMYGCIAAEAIDKRALKRAAKVTASGVALTGVGLSTLASIGYINDAGYLHTPRLVRALNRCDSILERYIPK